MSYRLIASSLFFLPFRCNWSFLSSILLANWIKSTKSWHLITLSTPVALLIPTQELFDSLPSLKEREQQPFVCFSLSPAAYKKALPVLRVARKPSTMQKFLALICALDFGLGIGFVFGFRFPTLHSPLPTLSHSFSLGGWLC